MWEIVGHQTKKKELKAIISSKSENKDFIKYFLGFCTSIFAELLSSIRLNVVKLILHNVKGLPKP
jgi:hypothetical protein